MSIAKEDRIQKRQKGQFITPTELARAIINDISFDKSDRILEPGFGNGSFLIPIIEAFIDCYEGSMEERIEIILNNNIWGVEIDPVMLSEARKNICDYFGVIPKSDNLFLGDFFETNFSLDELYYNDNSGKLTTDLQFTKIIGNPPFGGTIAAHLQDLLDRTLGERNGKKIKKETYSFFIAKCMDLLRDGGMLRFICSDTFLTISTMKGLRDALILEGKPRVEPLKFFSTETNYPMVVLNWIKGASDSKVIVDGNSITSDEITLTNNHSWRISSDLVKFFSGDKIGDYMIATSGMTTGNNALFVRKANDDKVIEKYDFLFSEVPITVANEVEKARLGNIPTARLRELFKLESSGATQCELTPKKLEHPAIIELPHEDYRPYNKATDKLVYSSPEYYIYWKNDGEALLTYKKTGKWYLRGVGGAKYFGMEGLTWRLISDTLDIRYLPHGYVLDSGSPCAFLREGVQYDEMFYIMGWTLTKLCNRILKQTINHTKNIQSKDFERLPYPFWVDSRSKNNAIELVIDMIAKAKLGLKYNRKHQDFALLEKLYSCPE